MGASDDFNLWGSEDFENFFKQHYHCEKPTVTEVKRRHPQVADFLDQKGHLNELCLDCGSWGRKEFEKFFDKHYQCKRPPVTDVARKHPAVARYLDRAGLIKDYCSPKARRPFKKWGEGKTVSYVIEKYAGWLLDDFRNNDPTLYEYLRNNTCGNVEGAERLSDNLIRMGVLRAGSKSHPGFGKNPAGLSGPRGESNHFNYLFEEWAYGSKTPKRIYGDRL